MARVFLSYAREDHDVREFLGSHLVAAGVEVFVDMALEPGTPAWTTELETALARMGGKKISDQKLLKNDNALFRSSGVFRSL